MIYLIETTYYNKNTKEILDLLKIGYTEDSNKDKRFTLYKLHNPGYKLLYEISGYDEDIEKRVQYKFRDLKYNEYGNEWFYYSDDIINFFKNIDNVDLESLPKSPRRREVEFTNLKNEIIDIIKYLFLTKEEYMNYLENLITILGDKFSVSSVLDYIKTDSLINKDLYSKYLEIVKSRESGIYCEDDMVNQEVSEFLRIYKNLKTIYDKLKMLCEYGLSEVEIDIVLGQLNDSDEVKSYYTILKPEKLKNLYYNSTNIKKYLGIVTFSPELLVNTIHQNFNPGEKYSLSNLKVKLGDLYSSISYTAVPKANDILNYFEVKEYMTTEVVDGKKKRVRGYELLKRKNN